MKTGELAIPDMFNAFMRLEKQEDLTPWIPVIVPLMAVLLAVCVFAICAAVLR